MIIMSQALTLDQLPAELLLKIFSYVSNRFNLSLVCSGFYDLVCDLDSFRYRLKIGFFRDDCSKLYSILQSQRNFDDMKIFIGDSHIDPAYTKFGQMMTIDHHLKIFEKYGNTIKNLHIDGTKISLKKLSKLIEYVPNIEKISFDIHIYDDFEGSWNVRKLRDICTEMTERDIKPLMRCLPKNVLNSFETRISLSEQTLLRLFEEQSNLEELVFNQKFVNQNTLDALSKLKLKVLSVTSDRNICKILDNQPHLICLYVVNAEISDNVALAIRKLKHLETLKYWNSTIESICIELLSGMTNLRRLSIDLTQSKPIDDVRAVSNISLPNLESLQLRCEDFAIPEECFVSMSRNFPKLLHFEIGKQSIQILGFILRHFRNLNNLILECDINSSEVSDFFVDGNNSIIHLNLRELRISGSSINIFKCFNVILRLVPNLTKLKLKDIIKPEVEDITNILGSLKNLTHLAVLNYMLSPKTPIHKRCFIEAISKNGQKLKFLQIYTCMHEIDDESLRKMFGHQFSVIQNKNNEILLRSSKWNKNIIKFEY